MEFNTAKLTLTSSDTIMDLAYGSDIPVEAAIRDWVRSANMEGKGLGVYITGTNSPDDMDENGVLTGTVMFDHIDNLRTWMSFVDPSLSDDDINDILSDAGL